MLYRVVGQVASNRRVVPVQILRWQDMLPVNANGAAHMSLSRFSLKSKNFSFKCGLIPTFHLHVGRDSSVGTATGYGLDGPGIESRWGRDFPHLSRPTLGPPSLLYNGYRVFPAGKERPGRDAVPSPTSSAVVKKE